MHGSRSRSTRSAPRYNAADAHEVGKPRATCPRVQAHDGPGHGEILVAGRVFLPPPWRRGRRAGLGSRVAMKTPRGSTCKTIACKRRSDLQAFPTTSRASSILPRAHRPRQGSDRSRETECRATPSTARGGESGPEWGLRRFPKLCNSYPSSQGWEVGLGGRRESARVAESKFGTSVAIRTSLFSGARGCVAIPDRSGIRTAALRTPE